MGHQNALISLDNLGFTRGLTVFTTMEARGEIIFHLEDHIKRLRDSAIAAFITSEKFDLATWIISFHDKIKETLKIHNFEESIIKIFMTGGFSKDGFLPQQKPISHITAEDKKTYPDKKSMRLSVMVFQRKFPQIKKTDDYSAAIIRMMELKQARKKVDDILYADENFFVSECSRANIFIINRYNELLTPNKALAGVTRNIVLKLAKEYLGKGLNAIKERNLRHTDVTSAKEIFITSTTQGVKPVVSVSGQKFKPGPVTNLLQKSFNDYREEYFKSRATT